MVKINLLPDVVLERRKQARIRRAANVSILAWVVLVAAIALAALGYQQYQRAMLSSAEETREETRAEAYSEENVEFRQEALSVQAGLDALAGLVEDRDSMVTFWETLAEYTHDDTVRLSTVSLDDNYELLMEGEAVGFEEVSEFERSIKQSGELEQDADADTSFGYFTDVSLLGVSVAEGGSASFSLRVTYHPPRAEVATETDEDDAQATEGNGQNGTGATDGQ